MRKFHNNPYIDIREYFGGDLQGWKPSKKGISLTLKQWQDLKKMMSVVDDVLETLK